MPDNGEIVCETCRNDYSCFRCDIEKMATETKARQQSYEQRLGISKTKEPQQYILQQLIDLAKFYKYDPSKSAEYQNTLQRIKEQQRRINSPKSIVIRSIDTDEPKALNYCLYKGRVRMKKRIKVGRSICIVPIAE